jgi:vesicle coat complex subunit
MNVQKNDISIIKEELLSDDPKLHKKGITLVISLMRAGEDLKELYPSMIGFLPTADFSIKCLIYIFVMTYARGEPELSILIVSSILKDAKDRNPLITAPSIQIAHLSLLNVGHRFTNIGWTRTAIIKYNLADTKFIKINRNTIS